MEEKLEIKKLIEENNLLKNIWVFKRIFNVNKIIFN